MSKKYSKELSHMDKSTLLYMLKDISNCLIEKHNFDYNIITMYIDNNYMSYDEFVKKYSHYDKEKLYRFCIKIWYY